MKESKTKATKIFFIIYERVYVNNASIGLNNAFVGYGCDKYLVNIK
jgi:hypothetical protein